jgi:putative transposase
MKRRRLRHLKEGATYHVVASANRGEIIFKKAAMKKLFLAFLKKAKKKYGFSVAHFCIMGNHVHLVIRPNDDATYSLSKTMQWLLGNFSKAWNKVHGLKGHLWKARFFSRVIENDADLRNVIQYLNENPVKAGLVKRAEEWEYGGLWHFITRNRDLLDFPVFETVYEQYQS